MEYTIDQLDNALLDIMKDYKDDELVDTITLYEKIKEVCPNIKTLNSIQAEQIFMDHVININKVYEFITPYVRNGYLFLVKTHPNNKTSCERMYGGYIPRYQEIKSFDSVINYHNDYLSIQHKLRMKDNTIKMLEQELNDKKTNLQFNISIRTAAWLMGMSWMAGLFTRYYLTGSLC